MLYLGHFSFDTDEAKGDEDDDDAVEHGYFTVLASAETVADAFEKFKVLIPRVGKEQELFDSGTRIYLDACIEIHEMPAEGVLAHVVVALDGENNIAASLLGAPPGTGQAYGWGEHDPDDEIASAAVPAVRGETVGTVEGEDDEEAPEPDDDGTRDISHAEPFLIVR
jgi:hypothetical protein